MNILICIPTYNDYIHSKLVEDIIDLLNKYNISFGLKCKTGSLIPRMRNQFLTYFYDHKQYTHMLFIDSDMFDFSETVDQLIQSGKDVIGGVYRKKMKYEEYNISLYNRPTKDELKDMCLEVKYVATGLMLISRDAVQTLINKFPERVYHERNGKRYFDFFMCGIVNDRYLSEDFGFCELYRQAGGKVYCVLDSEITHSGIMNYRGNFKDYLKKI